jgi:hypothetical protein
MEERRREPRALSLRRVCRQSLRCRIISGLPTHTTAGIRHCHLDEPGIRRHITDAAIGLSHETPQIKGENSRGTQMMLENEHCYVTRIALGELLL